MLAKLILCTLVSLAVLAVVLLALLSRVPQTKQLDGSRIDLSLYIQRPRIASATYQVYGTGTDALVFHQMLTEGPDNTSHVVGKAQGFIVPDQKFADSAFNMIYLTFETPGYSGSVSVQASDLKYKDREELTVVGGTGSFAFARGVAVFVETNRGSDYVHASYHLELQLIFPNRSHTIPSR